MKSLRLLAIIVVALVGFVVANHDRDQLPAPPPPRSSPVSIDASATSNYAPLAVLAMIPGPGEAPARAYERKEFGSGWGTNQGCDTRNRILARDLDQPTFKPGTQNCVVTSGTLIDPYAGDVVAFTKGDPSSMKVQIDHRIPLALSWEHGASTWTREQRKAFANDETNLAATAQAVNREKSADSPADWQPPLPSARCAYAADWVKTLNKWELTINNRDRRALKDTLRRC